MNTAAPLVYRNSSLRRDKVEATKARILSAMAALMDEGGGQEPTNPRRRRAGPGHRGDDLSPFPASREVLLRALWSHLNREAGVDAGLPESAAQLRAKIAPLFASFDASPAQIVARLTTAQGRAARAQPGRRAPRGLPGGGGRGRA